jgi:hypothetical protein
MRGRSQLDDDTADGPDLLCRVVGVRDASSG